jgi:hypothetical protein
VDPYGIITLLAGTNLLYQPGYVGDGAPALNATLNNPATVAMDSYGRVLIADTYNNRIRRFGQGPTLVLDKLTAANAGDYTLVINNSFGSVTSAVATLTVLLPPTITSQPMNQTAGLGSNATFNITVAGTLPLAYQWQMSGTNLPSQTNQSCNLTGVQWSDMGNYAVIITNIYGSITSVVATLTVGVPPSIISQPTNQIVLVGNNGLLSVVVSGDGLFSYQWQLNGTNLPPVIITVAGNGTIGFSGDGGLAINAKLNDAYAVTVDGKGNVFIADSENNRVRQVSTNGIITTFAGTGTSGHTGNGGQATNANLQSPQALCTDSANNIFISESFYGGEIRKINTNGIITVVAGLGDELKDGVAATSTYLCGPHGMAFDRQGNLLLSDYYYNRVRKIATNGIITTVVSHSPTTQGGFSGDGGAATNAAVGNPYGVAVDNLGNLIFADMGNRRIRKVDTNAIINTIVGGGLSTQDGVLGTNTYLLYPFAVCLDRDNNLYFTESGRVREMDVTGIVRTVAGGGSNNPGDYGAATNASLYDPRSLAFDGQGNLYICDRGGSRIRKVCFSGLPVLLLPNSSTNNAGNYSVVISSPFGSVVSSVATLTVLVPPQQFTSRSTSGGLQIQFSGTPNYPYILQSATNLTSPVNWQPVLTNPADGNGNWQFTDTNLNESQKFYRAVGQ